ncbi:hypothetical protein BU14_0142s0012 [Porphyra umbilicalis]|uniref:Uncharacterized protein n=1 Tax=Porphyra umbilicalis TaxID=2786 RepID=A0A1X6P9N6_PORUM|nr:hypothetical protein BU14_0142s0012 [Porphyra umbilicalis]|eukprot:OSX77602.1 hypothetical protein BU14_0142s0012 [Porphyra umbilicalis]
MTAVERAAAQATNLEWERNAQATIERNAAAARAEEATRLVASASSSGAAETTAASMPVPHAGFSQSQGTVNNELNNDRLSSAGTGEQWSAANPVGVAAACGDGPALGSLPVILWRGCGAADPPVTATAPEQPWGIPNMGSSIPVAPFSAPNEVGWQRRDASVAERQPRVGAERFETSSIGPLHVHPPAFQAPTPLFNVTPVSQIVTSGNSGQHGPHQGQAGSQTPSSRAPSKRPLAPAKDNRDPSSKRWKNALTLKATTRVVKSAAMLAARTGPQMVAAATNTATTPGGASMAGGKSPPALSRADDAVAKAVIDAMQPLCRQLAEAAEEIQRLREDLSRLAAKVHGQGVGQEHAVRAIVKIRDENKSNASTKEGHGIKVKTEVPFSERSPADKLAIAARNDAEMGAVRAEAREVHIGRAAKTNKSELVLANADEALQVLYEVAARVRGVDLKAAEVFIHSSRFLPTAKVDSKTGIKAKPKKMTEPLNQVVPHLVDKFKLWSLPAFWDVLQVVTPFDAETSMRSLSDKEFLTSDKGQEGIIAMAKAFFRSVGSHHRIFKKSGAGGGEYVEMTVGHYMLFGSFVRHELMIWAGHRRRKHPGGAGTIRRWVVEAGAVKDWLPRDDRIAGGMRLVDGAASRAYLYEMASGLPARDPADIVNDNGSEKQPSSGSGSGGSTTLSPTCVDVDDDTERGAGASLASRVAASTMYGTGGRPASSVAPAHVDEYADANLPSTSVSDVPQQGTSGGHKPNVARTTTRSVWL